MCVIIVRDPNIVVPHFKLESACIVNPDGWGIAVADRGKLEYRYDLKNDADSVAKALEDAKDHTVLLHLRFNTKGATNLENCHPFKASEEHNIAFAHNGTLYKYGPEKDDPSSDSNIFNRIYVQPLLKRCIALSGPEEVLKDTFLHDLLEDQAGMNSKFALLDGNGHSLIINHKEGKEFEGWWASNEYSFQRNHRGTANSCSTSGSPGNWRSYFDDDGETVLWEDDKKDKTKTVPVAEVTVMPPQYEPDETEEDEQAVMEEACQMAGAVIHATGHPKLNKKLIDALLTRKSPSFIELAGIDSLLEVTKLDPEDIADLVTCYPDAATKLIQDLLWELYLKYSVQAKAANAKAA